MSPVFTKLNLGLEGGKARGPNWLPSQQHTIPWLAHIMWHLIQPEKSNRLMRGFYRSTMLLQWDKVTDDMLSIAQEILKNILFGNFGNLLTNNVAHVCKFSRLSHAPIWWFFPVQDPLLSIMLLVWGETPGSGPAAYTNLMSIAHWKPPPLI